MNYEPSRVVQLWLRPRLRYTSDQRFKAIHHPHSEDWILQIKYPQHRDSGIYECQISTTPHMSHFIMFNVIGESPRLFIVDKKLLLLLLLMAHIGGESERYEKPNIFF